MSLLAPPRLFGYLIIWLYSLLFVWVYGRLVVWGFSHLVVWWLGCFSVCSRGFLICETTDALLSIEKLGGLGGNWRRFMGAQGRPWRSKVHIGSANELLEPDVERLVPHSTSHWYLEPICWFWGAHEGVSVGSKVPMRSAMDLCGANEQTF